MAVIGKAQPITRRVASSTITVMTTPMIMSIEVRFVDIEDAIDDVVVVDEQIEDRRRRRATSSA